MGQSRRRPIVNIELELFATVETNRGCGTAVSELRLPARSAKTPARERELAALAASWMSEFVRPLRENVGDVSHDAAT